MPACLGCHPAVTLVLIDDSHCLHEGVANSGPDEPEASTLQILAHRITLGGGLGDAAQVQRPPAQRTAFGELPNVAVEGALGSLDLKIRPGVGIERLDFESISDDAGIQQQAPALRVAVAGHLLRVENVECFAVGRALVQNGQPAQAGLRAFETQHLEELPVGMHGHSPLDVVIGDIQRVRRAPRAAQLAVAMTLRSQFTPIGLCRHRARLPVQQCRRTAWQSLYTSSMQSTPRVRRAVLRISCISLSSTRVLNSGVVLKRGSTPRCRTANRSCAARTKTATPKGLPNSDTANRVCTPAISPTRTRKLPSCSWISGTP